MNQSADTTSLDTPLEEELAAVASEREIAEAIVEDWMNSRPHREQGIYGDRWTSAGVGIAITDDSQVYAVMGFCSM